MSSHSLLGLVKRSAKAKNARIAQCGTGSLSDCSQVLLEGKVRMTSSLDIFLRCEEKFILRFLFYRDQGDVS